MLPPSAEILFYWSELTQRYSTWLVMGCQLFSTHLQSTSRPRNQSSGRTWHSYWVLNTWPILCKTDPDHDKCLCKGEILWFFWWKQTLPVKWLGTKLHHTQRHRIPTHDVMELETVPMQSLSCCHMSFASCLLHNKATCCYGCHSMCCSTFFFFSVIPSIPIHLTHVWFNSNEVESTFTLRRTRHFVSPVL